MGGWGKYTRIELLDFTPPRQKFRFSFFKKSSGSYLYSRTEVSGTAHPLYAALAAARKNSEFSDLGRVMVGLYEFERIHIDSPNVNRLSREA